MLQNLKTIIGYALRATDGDVGIVREFYFDDATWTIRYLVVETGTWLFNRKVLISTAALGMSDVASRTFTVNLTVDQIKNSPPIDTERPVYRQHEIELFGYYQWAAYWDRTIPGTSGTAGSPIDFPVPRELSIEVRQDDPHLRSTHEITGYGIHATDGAIGHVADFIIDEDHWGFMYVVADAGNWFFEQMVLVEVTRITSIKWNDSTMYLDCSQETVKNSPGFDPSKTILRHYAGTPVA